MSKIKKRISSKTKQSVTINCSQCKLLKSLRSGHLATQAKEDAIFSKLQALIRSGSMNLARESGLRSFYRCKSCGQEWELQASDGPNRGSFWNMNG